MHRAHAWKQSGSTSLWHYTENTRNFPGWHLSADAAACTSLLALLDALMIDGVEASRTIKIAPPSPAQLRTPNNKSGYASWQAPEKLRIAFSTMPSTWSFPIKSTTAVLTIGADWVVPLKNGISGITQGEGDYSIGPPDKNSTRLWFWW